MIKIEEALKEKAFSAVKSSSKFIDTQKVVQISDALKIFNQQREKDVEIIQSQMAEIDVLKHSIDMLHGVVTGRITQEEFEKYKNSEREKRNKYLAQRFLTKPKSGEKK